MAKADLHVHSKYSEHPSEWFLQRLGASESYTEPEAIYRLAKERGMDFVTITDHNRLDGVLKLREAHPADVFTGIEATAYFPEDEAKIHFLIYGLSEAEFREIQKIREDIYQLREYVRERKLAYSVAHATFFVNAKLRLEHLEKLMLLFNVFEGINGGRNRIANESWTRALDQLTPERIEDLRRRHKIEPWGRTPWAKSYTGGSDDHAALFIGRACTAAAADSAEAFLGQLREQKTWPEGRHNDYQSLAFTFYKIAYDFSKAKSSARSQSFFHQITETLFERSRAKESALTGWIRSRKIRSLKKRSKDEITARFLDLVEILRQSGERSLEERFDVVYDRLSAIADAFFAPLLSSLEKDLLKADVVSLVRNLSSALPGIFLSVPFFSTLRHMNQGRRLVAELNERYGPARVQGSKRVLWFTDTLTDLNGVAVTLRTIGRLAHEQKKGITIVTSLSKTDLADLPPNVLNLPSIHAFSLPGYESYALKIPSFLRSLKEIGPLEPDLVYISTPGPIGLLGLLMARLFNVPAVGIYHTDFALQSLDVVKDEDVARLLEDYQKWFYAAMDEVRVPTREYGYLLKERGYETARMTLFRRGVDGRLFAPRPNARAVLAGRFGVGEGPTLLFAGRVSQDKNLDFLLEVFKKLVPEIPGLNLIIAGDGPYLPELKARADGLARIAFTGALRHDELPDVYSGADLFVFPSTTDTYGMVVAEAQACGLPAVVSDRGGPKEIVVDGKTGAVLSTGSVLDWADEIQRLLDYQREWPDRYEGLRIEARRRALQNSDWGRVLDEITGQGELNETPSVRPTSVGSAAPVLETPAA